MTVTRLNVRLGGNSRLPNARGLRSADDPTWTLALTRKSSIGYDNTSYPRRFRAPLPAEPAHRSLGAIIFKAHRQSRDHRVEVGQAPYQCPRADSRRVDCDAR